MRQTIHTKEGRKGEGREGREKKVQLTRYCYTVYTFKFLNKKKRQNNNNKEQKKKVGSIFCGYFFANQVRYIFFDTDHFLESNL